MQVLRRFCEALGDYNPINRWLLLSDIDEEEIDPEEIHETCYCPMAVDGIDWFKSQVPVMPSCRLPKCHLTQTGCLGFPQCELNILQHCNQMSRSNCFHKLAHRYSNTITTALKHNKEGEKSLSFVSVCQAMILLWLIRQIHLRHHFQTRIILKNIENQSSNFLYLIVMVVTVSLENLAITIHNQVEIVVTVAMRNGLDSKREIGTEIVIDITQIHIL